MTSKLRAVRMTDELWSALNALGERNGRNTADEIRHACVHWLSLTGGATLSPQALTDTPQSKRRTSRPTKSATTKKESTK